MNENTYVLKARTSEETDEDFLRREAEANQWRREQNSRLKQIRANVEKHFGGTRAHWH